MRQQATQALDEDRLWLRISSCWASVSPITGPSWSGFVFPMWPVVLTARRRGLRHVAPRVASCRASPGHQREKRWVIWMNLPPLGVGLPILRTWYTFERDLVPWIDLALWDRRVNVLSRTPSPPGHWQAFELGQKHGKSLPTCILDSSSHCCCPEKYQ